MIFQSLYRYYQRLAQTDGVDIPREGFAPQKISFALELSPEGSVEEVIDLRVPEGKNGKLVPRIIILPALSKARTTDFTPYFLWDKTKFCLGADTGGKEKDIQGAFAAFTKLHKELLAEVNTPEAKSLLAFVNNWKPAKAPELENWEDMVGSNIVFRVGGRFLHECPELLSLWPRNDTAKEKQGICLVTGQRTAIAPLHSPIKGISGAQTSGASLSAFKIEAFSSFGKEKNLNAPVGKYAAFAYTTALNYLAQEQSQSVRFGKTTVLCWAEKEHPLEQGLINLIMGGEEKEARVDVSTAQERASLLRSLAQGKNWQGSVPSISLDTSLYVLGLVPNDARLAVTFFLQGTAEEFLEKIGAYYRELNISRYETDTEFPSVWQLARAMLAPQKKMADIARMGGDLLQSILGGYVYPAYALPAVLARLQAGENINAVRAGLIKAILIRNFNCEDNMKLNPSHPSQAYHLGRVFALLYSLQRKAIPGINAGIRERYYGAASTTPALVFPLLLGNAQNHIKKAKAGLYDKMITEIISNHIEEFPKHFSQQEQGEFALGFYHQRVNPDSQKADSDAITPISENEED
ncbi:type I-C CRISPR-associated protein Cas8c/Csd1 [Desulfovibrio sp. OttesenSCG-928-G15]|nr:type I-C CRISPR-associated protein Cas8c/Csd1 [Desulfovibrio sp. OttesenSCG-928-G15]